MTFKMNKKQALLLSVITLPFICFFLVMVYFLVDYAINGDAKGEQLFTQDAEEKTLEYFVDTCEDFDSNSITVHIAKEIRRDDFEFSFKRPPYLRAKVKLTSSDGEIETGEIEIDIEDIDSDDPKINIYGYLPDYAEKPYKEKYCPFQSQ